MDTYSYYFLTSHLWNNENKNMRMKMKRLPLTLNSGLKQMEYKISLEILNRLCTLQKNEKFS